MIVDSEVKFVVPAPPGSVAVECRNTNRAWYCTPLVAVAYDKDMRKVGHITFQDGGIGFYRGAYGTMFYIDESEITLDESDIDIMIFWHKARATVCNIADICSATICDVQCWIDEDDELPNEKYTNNANIDSLAKEFLAWNAASDQDASKFDAVLNALTTESGASTAGAVLAELANDAPAPPDTETVL